MKSSLLFTTLVFFFLQACSTLQQLAPKGSLDFVRSEIIYANLDRAEVVFIYGYLNPEQILFDSIVVNCELELDGKKAASVHDLRYTASANDTLLLNVPVRVSWLDYFGTSAGIVQSAQSGKWNAPSRMHTIATFYISSRSFQLVSDTKQSFILPHVPPYLQITL